MVETTTGGWICPYCHTVVTWGTGHICPAFRPSPQKVEEDLGEHYFKCPKCNEVIKVRIGHYLSFPDFSQEV